MRSSGSNVSGRSPHNHPRPNRVARILRFRLLRRSTNGLWLSKLHLQHRTTGSSVQLWTVYRTEIQAVLSSVVESLKVQKPIRSGSQTRNHMACTMAGLTQAFRWDFFSMFSMRMVCNPTWELFDTCPSEIWMGIVANVRCVRFDFCRSSKFRRPTRYPYPSVGGGFVAPRLELDG